MKTKLLLLPLLFTGACVGADMAGEVGFEEPIITNPTLAYVGPGVQVVADWSSPVFYADDYYWTWNDGAWLRSAWLGGPGVAVVDVPVGLRTVNHPWEFAHYHGAPGLTPTHVAFHEHSALRGGGMRGRR